MSSSNISFNRAQTAQSSLKFSSNSQVPHHHTGSFCCASATDSVDLASAKRSGRVKVDVAQANITQFPADAMIVGVFAGENVPAGVANAEEWKRDPNNASLARVLQNAASKGVSRNLDASQCWEEQMNRFEVNPYFLHRSRPVILVGLGKRSDVLVAEGQDSSEEEAAKYSAERAYYWALYQFGDISSLKDVKRVSMLLPCAERGQQSEDQYRRMVSNAAQALEPILDKGYGKSLEQITIVEADPERVSLIRQALKKQELSRPQKAKDSSSAKAPAPAKSSTQKKQPDPVVNDATGFFSSIWNLGATALGAIASVFTGLYNGIKALFGWK